MLNVRPGAVFVLVAGALIACAGDRRARPPAVASAPVLAKKGTSPASVAMSVDRALRARWSAAEVVPAPRADDATFLRRAYVDVVGTIPPPEVTEAFLADASPDKRARIVASLVASPEYAEHWMNYWDDALMGREARGKLVDRAAFRSWLHGRFAAHAPWDQIVAELLSATGRNGDGGRPSRGPALSVPMGSPATAAEADDDGAAPVNGAVNWTLRFEQTPQDLGGSASRAFLGVQIQCAQCHDHKTESWKQDDFQRFSSAFLRSRVEPASRAKPNGAIRRVELVDAPSAPPRFARNPDVGPLVRARATALDGTDLERGKDTRKALASWITAKQNPWFARAFVNRMWGHFLGRGFHDPVDDIRPSNPATAPEILDTLAADFASHDFDVGHLIRTICATEVYNVAASASATVDPENKLWGRFHLVPLGPEELLNAILRATDLARAADRAGLKDVDGLRADVVRQYAFLFDTDEETDAPDYSGTVSQALAMINGPLVAQGARALPGGTVAELLRAPATDADRIDGLVVKVLGRHATPEEKATWAAYVAGGPPLALAAPLAAARPAGAARGKRGPLERLEGRRLGAAPKQAAYEDVLWVLLNSSEFTFNH